jgi:hypothetical protein
MDTLLCFVELIWMQEVKTYLRTGKMPKTLNLIHKQKLARKAKPFIMKEGIMYRVGQDNKMWRCLTTSEAQIVLKELHGVARKHIAIDFTTRTFWVQDIDWWPILFKDTHDFRRSYDNY